MATDVYVFLKKFDSFSVNHREAYPFGPTDNGGFNMDLGIEINPAVRSYYPALAVVSGLARFIPDPQPATTGTLVLKPMPDVMRDLTSILGICNIVFIYRNLESSDVQLIFTPSITKTGELPIIAQESPPIRIQRFMNGEFLEWVDAGSEVGIPSCSGGNEGWGRVGFEIAFIPNGLSLDKSRPGETMTGWDRLVQLIDPTIGPTKDVIHRLDPASFYGMINGSANSVQLAASHIDHGIFSKLTRRILLEIRDEYNKPVIDIDTPSSTRGICVLQSLAPTDTTSSQTITIEKPNYVYTDLPSGTEAQSQPTKILIAPSHWALQKIFMADEDSHESWFVENVSPMPRYTEGNQVTPIRDGIEVFSQYAAAIRTLKNSDHYMYLAGWIMMDDFPLIYSDSTSTMRALTTCADGCGAKVRAILWDRNMFAGQEQANIDSVDHINQLPCGNGEAILDGRTLGLGLGFGIVGSHHQKFLVINGNDGAFAFCGGVDINPNRLDSDAHNAEGAFHDVHAKVEGPAVADIHRSFVDRWNDPDITPPLTNISTNAPPFCVAAGSIYVQVARTYPPRKHYSFAPSGSLTPLEAAIRAFSKARKFIYIEDQYLTPYPGGLPFTEGAEGDPPVGILTALQQALPNIDYLIIVIPNHCDLPQARYRRMLFIENLRAVAADKVHVFYLARLNSYPIHDPAEVATEGGGPGCSGGSGFIGDIDLRSEIYCHTKSWIVDDICAKIGSGNMNRRSYTHDSEMDIVMVDGALNNSARAFARNYRLKLWGEHLNMAGEKSAFLEDHMYALQFWLNPLPEARIRPYEDFSEVGVGYTDIDWNLAWDPDGR